MTVRFIARFLLVCALGPIACDSREQIIEPAPLPAPAPTAPEPQFDGIQAIGLIQLVEGDTVRLKPVPVDRNGRELTVAYTATYTSFAPSIATVSETGLVTGVTAGSARITVTIVVGGTTKTANVTTFVFTPVSPSSIVFTFGTSGWNPSHAQLKPGGTVEWRTAGSIDWIYLLYDSNEGDSVAVRSGSATRRFDFPGRVWYCSGLCWDPADWGTIFIRE